MPPKKYKITRIGTFDKDVKRIEKDVPRLKEFLKGAEEVLARDPSKGKRTKHKILWSLGMIQLEDFPRVTLYYFPAKKDEIVLVWLRKEGDPKPPKMIL